MVLLESVLSFFLLSVSLICGGVVPEETTIVPLEPSTLTTHPTLPVGGDQAPPTSLATTPSADDGKSASEPLKPNVATPPGKGSSPVSVVKNVIHTLKKQAQKLFTFLKHLIGPITNHLKNLLHSGVRLVGSVIGKLKNLFTFDKKNGNPVINLLSKVVGPVVDGLKTLFKPDAQNPIVKLLKTVVGPVIDTLKNLLKSDGNGNFIVNLFNRIITQVINYLKNLSKPHDSTNGNPIVNIVKNLLTPVTDFMDVLLEPYDSDGNTIVDLIKRFFNANMKLLKKIFNQHSSNTDIFIINKGGKSIKSGVERGLQIPIDLIEGPKNILNHFVNFLKNIYASPEYGSLSFFKILSTKPAIVLKNVIRQFIILLRNILTPYVPSSLLSILPNDKEAAERGVKIILGPFDLVQDFLSHFVNFLKNILSPPGYGSFGIFKMIFTHPVAFVKNVYAQFIILVKNILTPFVPSKFIDSLTSLLPHSDEGSARGLEIPLGSVSPPKTSISTHLAKFLKDVFAPPEYGLFEFITTVVSKPAIFLNNLYRQSIVLARNILTPYVSSEVIDFLINLLPKAFPSSDEGAARGLQIPVLSLSSNKSRVLTHIKIFLKNIYSSPEYGSLNIFKIILTKPVAVLENVITQFFILLRNLLAPYVPSKFLAFLPNDKAATARGLKIVFLPLDLFKSFLTHFVTFLKNVFAPPGYGFPGLIKILFSHPVVFVRNVYVQFILLLRNVVAPYVPNNFIGFLMRLLPHSDPNYKEAAARGLPPGVDPVVFFKKIMTHFSNFFKNCFASPEYGSVGFFKIIFTQPVLVLRIIYTQIVILVRNVVVPYVPSNVVAFLTKLLPPGEGGIAIVPAPGQPAPGDKVAVSQPAPSKNKGFLGFLWTKLVFVLGFIRKITVLVIWKVGGFGLTIFGKLLHHGIFLLLNFLPWPASAIVTAILTKVDYCPRFDYVHPLVVFVSRGSQCVSNPLWRIWELLTELIQTELSLFRGYSFFGVIRRVIALKMKIILTIIKEIIGFFPCVGWVGVKMLWTSFRCVIGL